VRANKGERALAAIGHGWLLVGIENRTRFSMP
jgi:hypothetical protein